MNRTILLGTFAASLVLAGPASAEPARYDGPWTVQMVKDSGSCDASALRYAITIRDGAVRYGGGEDVSFSGQVGPNGGVTINASKGFARVSGSGQLQANAGSGTWRLPLLGCSGRWTARRTGTMQASAS